MSTGESAGSRPSRVASVSGALGCAALAFLALGPLSVQLGLGTPFVGFRLFALALPLGFLSLLLGAAGLWRTRAGAGRSGRGRAALGFVVGAVIPVLLLILVGSALRLPAINDITTDTVDPPEFVAIARVDANAGRDLSYPGEAFAAQQQDGYPDLAPIRLDRTPVQAYEDVRRAVHALGWQVVGDDPDAGVLEASDVSRVFHFVDDVVIRVRPAVGGSVVDVRSKSRDGKGDLGVNAARIRTFRNAISG